MLLGLFLFFTVSFCASQLLITTSIIRIHLLDLGGFTKDNGVRLPRNVYTAVDMGNHWG